MLLRTPGRERDLVAGFLASEGVLRGPEDLTAVEACPDPETGRPAVHVWNAALAEGVAFDPRRRRFAPVGSSCGLCGARTLEELQRVLPGLPPGSPLLPAADELLAGFEELRRRQPVFAATAGVHGAALALPRPGGGLELADVAEDVGRHNATDKVLGACLLAGDYPREAPAVLLVSGRISFEIVQKAALAGVGTVAGVGVPTSLAADAAASAGQALYGWARDGGARLYVRP